MKLKLITGSLLAAASLLTVNLASAETVTLFGLNTNIGGGQKQYDDDVQRATVTCTTCDGALSDETDGATAAQNEPLPALDTMVPGVWGDTSADLFELDNSSEAGEIAAVNAITGGSFDLTDYTKINDPALIFTTDAEYILFKIGEDPNYALIRNNDGSQQFIYAALTGGSGLSHIALFGGETFVSEPAILALFGVGLVLLGFMRRRAIA